MKRKLATHAYTWDGITDPTATKPIERCANCGLPKTHPRHQLRPVDDDTRNAENRRYAERTP
jgi:hypothetical protein